MSSERRTESMEPEKMKELFSIISREVPGMIMNIMNSVFSEEAGRNMGKAAAAYYNELKSGGLPDEVAVKLTEEYMRTFTSIGDMLRNAGRSGLRRRGKEEKQESEDEEEEE